MAVGAGCVGGRWSSRASFPRSQGAVVVHNQPYDETLEVSDGEEVASTTASPRVDAHPAAGTALENGSRYNDALQQTALTADGGRGGGERRREGGVNEGRGGGGGGRRGGRGGGGMGYVEEDDSGEEQSEEDSEDGPRGTLSG